MSAAGGECGHYGNVEVACVRACWLCSKACVCLRVVVAYLCTGVGLSGLVYLPSCIYVRFCYCTHVIMYGIVCVYSTAETPVSRSVVPTVTDEPFRGPFPANYSGLVANH